MSITKLLRSNTKNYHEFGNLLNTSSNQIKFDYLRTHWKKIRAIHFIFSHFRSGFVNLEPLWDGGIHSCWRATPSIYPSYHRESENNLSKIVIRLTSSLKSSSSSYSEEWYGVWNLNGVETPQIWKNGFSVRYLNSYILQSQSKEQSKRKYNKK